ncbi:MAG TPA: Na/Pi cotransporter family protein [Verrucomicrobiae bacterium]|nr:Na/Pi cotransporter family protein [Verrucomicrobiae bacterium]
MLSGFNFLAGIALMLLGTHDLRVGSDRAFGAKLRQWLRTATKRSLRAMIAGFLISVLLPSSTAVSLLAVEAIDAGYVTLPHMLALMLGANIGFTVTVQLLAFKFYIYYAIFIVAGAPFYLFSPKQTTRGAGQILLGVGFLLLSIGMLTDAVAPWKNSAEIRQVLELLENHPWSLVGFTALLTVALQSPTSAVGIAMALCIQQVLTLNAAVAMVIGANIGVAVTGLIAGFARSETRRMAIGNLLFKLVGALACTPLLPPLIRALKPISPSGDAQLIANAHLLFNVAITVVFLPLVAVAANLLEKFVPELARATDEFGPRYLDPSALASPALALAQVAREILHMGDIVRQMLHDAHACFHENDDAQCQKVQKADDKIDLLNSAIKTYITRVSESALRPEESRREVALLTFATELETIGDIIDKNLMDLARKKIAMRVDFSREGADELDGFFQKVLANFDVALSAFASQDKTLADQLLARKREINELERDLRNRHFHRLQEGLKESFETSAIHLDVLTNLKAINSHLTSVAYPIVENNQPH